MKMIEMTGMTFGRYRVISFHSTISHGNGKSAMWLWARIKSGWSVEKALLTPVGGARVS